MSLDPHSLEQLRQLGRQLPEQAPPPIDSSEKKKQSKRYQHKIETEEDPKALFHELMKASPDGNIPPHLFNRLKKLERKESTEKQSTLSINPNKGSDEVLNQTTSNLKRKSPSFPDEELKSLYETFQDLLLDHEEDT